MAGFVQNSQEATGFLRVFACELARKRKYSRSDSHQKGVRRLEFPNFNISEMIAWFRDSQKPFWRLSLLDYFDKVATLIPISDFLENSEETTVPRRVFGDGKSQMPRSSK